MQQRNDRRLMRAYARTVPLALLLFLAAAAPGGAMMMQAPPAFDFYASGGGGGYTGTGGGTPRPDWVDEDEPIAPVENATDLTLSYDELMVRQLYHSGTAEQQDLVDGQVTVMSLRATVHVDHRYLDTDASPQGQDLSALALVPGHGWFLHHNRAPADAPSADPSRWDAAIDDAQEWARVSVVHDCGGSPLTLTADAMQASAVSDGQVMVVWNMGGGPRDQPAGTGVNVQQVAQRNDRLSMTVRLAGTDRECTATATYEVQLLVANEYYQSPQETLCDFVPIDYTGNTYHHVVDFELTLKALQKDLNRKSLQSWADAGRETVVLYAPVLVQGWIIHHFPTVEAFLNSLAAQTGPTMRGANLLPDGRFVFAFGTKGVSRDFIGIYHTSDGVSATSCVEIRLGVYA